MKLFFKSLQYFIKFLASILSKIGAQNTYTKLYKLFMKYKFILVLFKPLKFLFQNFAFILKLVGFILSILTLFQISLLHFNYDLMNDINYYLNEFIKWVRNLYLKIFNKEEEEVVVFEDYREFFNPEFKKEIKVIEKSVQNIHQNSWIVIPYLIIGGFTLYYFGSNFNEIIEPIISKIEDKIPTNIETFVSGMFIYKFIAFSFTKISGIKLSGFDRPKDPDTSGSSVTDYFTTEDNKESIGKKLGKEISYGFKAQDLLAKSDSGDLTKKDLMDFKYTPENSPDETPKASTSALPADETDSPLFSKPFSYPPKIHVNPFAKKAKERFMENFSSKKVEIPDNLLKDLNPDFE